MNCLIGPRGDNEMNVLLKAYTPDPDHVIATAARQCYAEGFVGDNWDFVNEASDAKLIEKIINCGHTSCLEHASFTFAIEGVSRALSHQLVRFRHASFSQQSQRYVTFNNGFNYIIPPSIRALPEMFEAFEHKMADLCEFYNILINAGIPAEDARFIAPNACETKIIVTMNAREIHHACGLRECNHAQWEIKELFETVNKLVKPVAPVTFAKLGPSCVTKGVCSEGPRCCGRINSIN